jgi:hypothetical protein
MRVRFTQQYQRLGATASEGGGTLSVEAARVAGDSIELQLSGKRGDDEELLRFAGRVTGAGMNGTVRSGRDTTARPWRAVRP